MRTFKPAQNVGLVERQLLRPHGGLRLNEEDAVVDAIDLGRARDLRTDHLGPDQRRGMLADFGVVAHRAQPLAQQAPDRRRAPLAAPLTPHNWFVFRWTDSFTSCPLLYLTFGPQSRHPRPLSPLRWGRGEFGSTTRPPSVEALSEK